MKAWKKQWKQYTNYLRNQGFPLDNKLYAEMLVNKCDVTMRLPLEAMDNLYQMGEDLLWEKIENIYKESNPIFMRRVKCYESKITKGELLSEFATRLKLEYKESEMSKTTIWGHFEYKLLAGLDTAGSDNRELKSKLVEEIKKNPDPTEKELDEFLQIVRDHESMIRAREHRETDDVRNNLNRVTTGTGIVEPGWAHRVCGKVHGKGKCEYKCTTCGKPHKEEDCYTQR